MTPEQNSMLCRVEGDAPMGKLMRQHWLPACMVEEVSTPDCDPVRVRLLGEDLVVFRDTRGRLGALDEHCPHRGASLAFGRNEECGLRCLYHGWKFDVDGTACDIPSEPRAEKLRTERNARAYPVRECAGFVWVWMGNANACAPFDPPAWGLTPDARISIVKMHAACNWAQVLEGAIDSSHSSSLHATNMRTTGTVESSTATETEWLRPSDDRAPRIEVQQTSFGFRYAAIRRPIKNADTHYYIRTTVFIAPFTVLIPPNDRYNLSQMLVPTDDLNCMFYWIAWHPTKGIEQSAWRAFCGAVVGTDVDATFHKIRNASNRYLQDRKAMRTGEYTGIHGIPAQDMAMWESMGPIANRSRDRLGPSDRAIIQFRKQMLAAVRAVASGQPAIGSVEPRLSHVFLTSFEGIVPKSKDWRTLNISEEERRLTAGGSAVSSDKLEGDDT